MGPIEEALSKVTCVLFRKGNTDALGTHTCKKGHSENTAIHLQAKERGLRRSHTFQHLDFGLPISTTVRISS